MAEIGPELPTPVFGAVDAVEAEGGDVVVRLAEHVAPGLQEVEGPAGGLPPPRHRPP